MKLSSWNSIRISILNVCAALIAITTLTPVANAGGVLTTAWLSVIGFFVMLWTYFGVNLLLPGLHACA